MIWSNEMLVAKIREVRAMTERPNLPMVAPPEPGTITPWSPEPVTFVEGLRRIRAKVAAGKLLFFALHETFQGEDVNRVEDLLTQVMVPSLPFWEWVESKDRHPWDVARAIDIAILRAKKLS